MGWRYTASLIQVLYHPSFFYAVKKTGAHLLINMTFIYYICRSNFKENTFFIKILKLCLLFSCLIFFFAPIAKFSMRLEVYLSTLYPVLYIYALSQFKNKLLFRFLLCFIYMFYSFYVFSHPSIKEGITFNLWKK